MKIFVDSDVIIDFLTNRGPYSVETKTLMNAGINGKLTMYSSSLILANVYYIIAKYENKKVAEKYVILLSSFIKVLDTSGLDLLNSIDSNFSDFEDGIQHSCAIKNGMHAIVTRNVKDYKHSTIAIHNPKEILALVL